MIIVSGGTGYIGSHTVVELLNEGLEVTILDDLSNSDRSVLERIKEITGKEPSFHCVDLSDPVATSSVFKAIGANALAVIHFAAKKAVGESVKRPLYYYQNNLQSLMNVLQEMEKHTIANLVFSSSCTVYGQPDICPVNEETPRKEAESPYGNTKAVCEDIIRDVCAATDMNAISLRYFNPVGAHPSGKIGELPVGIPNNLVPYVTQTAAGIREQLTIFGDDYDTPDGTCIRDYIHVVDLAKAHVKALKKLQDDQHHGYDIYNIGTGNGNSVLEVVSGFENATGIKINYTIGPRRDGDITKVFADTDKANNELNWKAELSLEEALRSSWNWEKKYRSENA